MKRLMLSIMIILLGGSMTVSDSLAQSSRESHSTSQKSSGQRPGRGGNHKDNKHGYRPASGSRPTHSGSNNRPGSGGNHNGGNHNGNRPGNNHGGNHGFRPGGNGTHHYRPGANHHRPTPPHHHRPGHIAPPVRPWRMPYRNWSRPVPPRTWRPVYRRPLLSDFIGLTFGLTFNTALDRLYNSGYSVDGYGSDTVYLRNVREQDYYWDDATLYFSNGVLTRSQFYESSPGNSRGRYNGVYNRLCSLYGNPVNQSIGGSAVTATWFGYSGDYITLEYTPMYTGGSYRYFTILTYGN